MGHTQGPWTINQWTQSNSDVSVGAIGTPIIARMPLRDVSINEQMDNARLCSAAPELYLLLKRFYDATYGEQTTAKLCDLDFEQARAVIAKAKGE